MNKTWNWIGVQILKFKIAILATLFLATIWLAYTAIERTISVVRIIQEEIWRRWQCDGHRIGKSKFV